MNIQSDIFAKDIIRDWGLGGLSETKQVEMVDRISRLLYQAVLVQSLDILSEKEQVELDLLLDEDTTTPQDVLVFLHSKIPTFDLLIKTEQDKLKEDILVPTV